MKPQGLSLKAAVLERKRQITALSLIVTQTEASRALPLKALFGAWDQLPIAWASLLGGGTDCAGRAAWSFRPAFTGLHRPAVFRSDVSTAAGLIQCAEGIAAVSGL